MMIAILVCVFYVSIGKGGELAYAQADHAPLDLGTVSAADVALLRPPTALWGYNMQVTDEALDTIARALRERDIEIAYLHSQLTGLGHQVPQIDRSPGFAPRHASELSDADDMGWPDAIEESPAQAEESAGQAVEPGGQAQEPEGYTDQDVPPPDEAHETHETHEPGETHETDAEEQGW